VHNGDRRVAAAARQNALTAVPVVSTLNLEAVPVKVPGGPRC